MNINFKNRIYGRTKGRNCNRNKNNELISKIEQYKITALNKSDKNILDIGSGYGETSLFLSKTYPNSKIIACDKYIDGHLNLIKKFNNKINNIFIHNGNVYDILDNLKKGKYFDSIWIMFPDPWPKNKHKKRRLINDNFLSIVSDFIKDNGNIFIASDLLNYNAQIISSIYKNRHLFTWENQFKIYYNYKDYLIPETKYFKKAVKSGRNPFFITLKKI